MTATRVQPLLAGYDLDYFTLPATLLAARATVTRLHEVQVPEPAHPLDARDQHVTALVEAAAVGHDLPAPVEYRQAVQAHADWLTHGEFLRDAVALAESRLSASDSIIADHLAPAMVEVSAHLEKLGRALPDEPTDRLIASPGITAKAREAWRDLDAVAARYAGIRAGQAAVTGPAPVGDDGEWSAFDALTELWPGWATRRTAVGNVRPPWPDDPRTSLLWMSRHGAQFVVLTRTEREQRDAAKYGDERQRLRELAANARAFGGVLT